MKEIWKDIKGSEGKYQVSNLGRIQSLNYRGSGKNHILSTTIINGYTAIVFRVNGVYKSHLVHRLVAEAFIPNPEGKPHVDHINTVRTDNRVENLRWCTRAENMNNPLTIAKLNKYRNSVHYTEQVIQMTEQGKIIGIYPNAKMTGIHHVGRCCNGERKTAGGYKWQYISDYMADCLYEEQLKVS